MSERATPGQANAGDVLDRIDQAVNGPSLCACGCGQEIRADGPSEWFAGQGCQHRWMQGQATEPEDVYERVDANGHNIDPDAPGAVRQDVINGYAERRVAEWQFREHLARQDAEREEQARRAEALKWRRLCPRCGQRSEPRVVSGRAAVTALGGTVEPITERPLVREGSALQCPHCDHIWDGPVLTVSVRHDFSHERGFVALRMEDENGVAVMTTLSVNEMTEARGHQALWAYVDEAWDDMERRLLRANRRDFQRRINQWAVSWQDSLSVFVQAPDPREFFQEPLT